MDKVLEAVKNSNIFEIYEYKGPATFMASN